MKIAQPLLLQLQQLETF